MFKHLSDSVTPVFWESAQGIAQPPSKLQALANRGFGGLCKVSAWASVLLVAGVIGTIAVEAAPAIQRHGLSFLVGTTWDVNERAFSILPEIWGTVYSSVIALLLGGSFGLAAALFLAEGFLAQTMASLLARLPLPDHAWVRLLPVRFEQGLQMLVELLAAIPSVVYGLWGLYVVIPAIRPFCNMLHERFGGFALFGTSLSGPGMLPASLVLGIMILPTITALSRDALVAVPKTLRMAAYGLGATRWEAILRVLLPTASRGIFGAVVLAFGRALGETMALAMLVGNSNVISISLFSPANTLAALLANTFPEAGPKEVSVLMYAALVLLAITLAVNVLGSLLMLKAAPEGTKR